jgi:hypothetical protein
MVRMDITTVLRVLWEVAALLSGAVTDVGDVVGSVCHLVRHGAAALARSLETATPTALVPRV